ncbi:MAG: flagellar protein FliT [Methyloglobulus sp.]|nr:flagellar protein FliT [Methyloglobulus sp.]
MTDKIQDLQDLMSLSRKMLEKAREKSWDDVIVLEAERSKQLRLFFLERVQQEHVAAVKAAAELMISMDNEITELGELKRLDLAQALQNLGQGKKAVKAYTS